MRQVETRVGGSLQAQSANRLDMRTGNPAQVPETILDKESDQPALERGMEPGEARNFQRFVPAEPARQFLARGDPDEAVKLPHLVGKLAEAPREARRVFARE